MLLPPILIPACVLSRLAFLVMCLVYGSNKQGDSVQSCCTPFSIWNSKQLLPHSIPMPDPGCRENSAETVPESLTPQFQPGSPSCLGTLQSCHLPPRVPLCTLSITSVFLATPNTLTRPPQAYSQVHSPLTWVHTQDPITAAALITPILTQLSTIAQGTHSEARGPLIWRSADTQSSGCSPTHCETLLKRRVWATSYLNTECGS